MTWSLRAGFSVFMSASGHSVLAASGSMAVRGDRCCLGAPKARQPGPSRDISGAKVPGRAIASTLSLHGTRGLVPGTSVLSCSPCALSQAVTQNS